MSDFELISSDDELKIYSYEPEKHEIINEINILKKNVKNIEIKNNETVKNLKIKINNLNNTINILTDRLDFLEKPISEKIELFWDDCQNFISNCFK